MAQPKTFFQRMGHHGLCVLLCDMVDTERANTSDASKEESDLGADGLCYASLTTIRSIGGQEYLARVSATPDLAGAYTVLLAEDQLRYCLAFDARLEGKSPMAIRAAICTHAREIQPVRALPMEHGHFLEQLRSQPDGTIAQESGAFTVVPMRLAKDPSNAMEPMPMRLAKDPSDAMEQTPMHDDATVVDFPLNPQDVNEAIGPYQKRGGDPSHPRIRAHIRLLHFDVVLKAIDNRRKRLMESWQEEFAESLDLLCEARERIKLLRIVQANTNTRQPVTRADVYGLKKRKGGLGKRGRGLFIIEKALMQPLVA